MAGESQRIKILYILKILWEETDENHPMTAEQIARRVAAYGMHCERKSIYSNLEELEAFGFDIVRGKQGAYLGTRLLELPELKLLVDAVQSSQFITEKKSEELITKLEGLISRFERVHLRNQVYVESRVKTMNESIYYIIDAVNEGIRENCKIDFVYWNWNVQKEMVPKHDGRRYVVSPWFLMWEKERYYLLAYDDNAGEMKHFRIDKMQDIRLRGEKRQGKEAFGKLDIGSFSRENFGMFQGIRETVTLQAENELAGVVIDRFGRDVWMHPAEEGYFTAVVEVIVSNQFFGWITGLGGGVQITGPSWVQEEYHKLLYICMEGKEKQ
ncbi:MAG: helix-turn-helix transcriptional regulator [Lachnospiraceae bacterium]